MSKETGGPAFPGGRRFELGDGWQSEEGMTLRDYFAAKAMQGILSNPGQLDNVNEDAAKWVTRDAYKVADAMLKARAAISKATGE